jgi:Flp pilus assembly protein TadB
VTVGGGLHDQDPEPDRHQMPALTPGRRLKAVQREWLFWGVLALLLAVASRGQLKTVILFVVAVGAIVGGWFLTREVRSQWAESKDKGFFR